MEKVNFLQYNLTMIKWYMQPLCLHISSQKLLSITQTICQDSSYALSLVGKILVQMWMMKMRKQMSAVQKLNIHKWLCQDTINKVSFTIVILKFSKLLFKTFLFIFVMYSFKKYFYLIVQVQCLVFFYIFRKKFKFGLL